MTNNIKKMLVHAEDAPDLREMIRYTQEEYLTNFVEIYVDGMPAAVLVDSTAAQFAAVLVKQFKNSKPPFTREALDKWAKDNLIHLDINELMNG